jgi:hypothetical protein
MDVNICISNLLGPQKISMYKSIVGLPHSPRNGLEKHSCSLETESDITHPKVEGFQT